jgi:hypothetical protein
MKAATALWLFLPAFVWTTAALADCRCMANGRTFHHGEIACLRLPSGPQLARCGMVLNNSSWIKLQDGCPSTETGGQVPAVSVTTAPMTPAPMTPAPRLRPRAPIQRS